MVVVKEILVTLPSRETRAEPSEKSPENRRIQGKTWAHKTIMGRMRCISMLSYHAEYRVRLVEFTRPRACLRSVDGRRA